MGPEWKEFIDSQSQEEYFIKLKEFIKERRSVTNVIPTPKDVFKPFELCNWGTVFQSGENGSGRSSGPSMKVVIVGGEPYPNRGASHGLSFSSLGGNTPTALQAIFDEIHNDIYLGNTGKTSVHQSNDLSQWAKQGVLLLNSVVTIDEGKPGSHAGKGWEIFTGKLLKHISDDYPYRLAFMFWGSKAQEHVDKIDLNKHLVLTSDHPGSTKHSQNKWYGNRHFSQANAFIKKHYWGERMEINWGIFNNKRR